MAALPTGSFTCDVTLQRLRSPQFIREEKDGVTYLTARDYEITYETTLRFEHGATLSIKALLFGELNQKVVVRNAEGTPTMTSGYVQGRAEIFDTNGTLMFRGRYYDYRAVQPLTGEGVRTLMGPSQLDHLENGLGEGLYVGHAFALIGRLSRKEDEATSGKCHGHID